MREINNIYHDDFLNNGLPAKSVQLIIADPPYFEVKGGFDFIWPSFDAYLADVEKWAQECQRVLADNGTLFWWGDKRRIAYSQIILDKYFNLENSLVWRKVDSMQYQYYSPESARTFNTHNERLLMYSNESDGMDLAELNYSYKIGMKHTEVMEPLISYLISEMERAGLTRKDVDRLTGTCMASHWFSRTSQWALPTKEWYLKLREVFNGEYLRKEYEYLRKEYEELRKEYEELRKEYEELRRPFNNTRKLEEVLEFSQEGHVTKNYDHDTVKPEKLTRALILTCSRPGDLVLAPFAGSGTECAMAAKEGRKFIGFDIDEKHVRTAQARCKEVLRQPQLF